MFKKYIVGLLTALSLVVSISVVPQSAHAGSVSANTQATATLAKTCVVQTQNLNFGNITPGQTSRTTSATMSVLCTKNTSYNMTLQFWEYGVDCVYMKGQNSGDKINYGTWLGSVGGTVLQNNTSIAETGTGATQNFTFYSQIAPVVNYGGCPTQPKVAGINPYATPDNYSDTVTFYVSY